jgi:TonB family protein
VRDKVPAPDVQLLTVPVDFPGLRQVEFDDSVQDELSAVIAPLSVPHLARVQSVDLAAFERRLKLPQGTALTILLRVEVTEDGWVDSADVVRTSGNVAADAAAIDYVQALRWVPGTIDHVPQRQRVTFSVMLTSAGTDLP